MAQCYGCEGTPTLNLGGSHAEHPFCRNCFRRSEQTCPFCDSTYTPSEKTRISSFLSPQLPGSSRPQMPQMLPRQAAPAHTDTGSLGRLSPCSLCSREPTDPVKMPNCGHMFCRAELKSRLTEQAANSKDVKCPAHACAVLAPSYFLMMMLDQEAFQAYRLKYLNVIFVTCPQCSVIEQIARKHRVVQCSNCELHYCSRCTKKKEECHCLPPEEMICRNCCLLMNPEGRHRKIVCMNCNAITCTYCGGDNCACNHNALTAVTRLDDVVECPICDIYISIDNLENIIAMEDCKHVFHKECIQDYVVNTLESGRFSKELNCPKQNCMGIVGNFQSLVSAEQWDMYNQRLLETRYKIIQCPNSSCLESFAIDGEPKHVTCPNARCNLAFCLQCKELPHEGSCSRSNILNRIREMEATGDKVSQCPGCKLPYIKDEHCQHVKCMNTDCGVEFCFTCSCLRKPTTAHCNAWHRPDCAWYRAVGVEEEKKRKDCPECERLGRRCDPPKQLRVPCRFDEDEV